MRRIAIRHVDAFTAVPLEGNPAAVVGGDGETPDTATMQRIALNQHLSETVFLLPPESPENHARVRIFTPAMELPFAGHPIVATAHVLVSEGRARELVLRIETGAGVIAVDVSGDATDGCSPRYTMTQASPRFRDCEFALDEIAAWLGLRTGEVVRAEFVSTGLEWLVAQVASLEAVERASPGAMAASKSDVSFFCIGAADPEASVRVRTFAPAGGIVEDPVTGSSNGCIGALIAKHGLLPQRGDGAVSYVAEQGVEMGQPGRIFVTVSGEGDGTKVQVGGHAVTVLEGALLLP